MMNFDQVTINQFSGGFEIRIPIFTVPFTNPEISNNQRYIGLPLDNGVDILVRSSSQTELNFADGEKIKIDKKSQISHKWYDPFVLMEMFSEQRGWKTRPYVLIKTNFTINDNVSIEYALTLGAIYSFSLSNNVFLSNSEIEQISYEIMERLKYEFSRFKIKSLLNGRFSEIIYGDDENVKGEIFNFNRYRIFYIKNGIEGSNHKYIEFRKNFNSIKKKLSEGKKLNFPYSGYKIFYENEKSLFDAIINSVEKGDMDSFGKSIYNSAVEIRDNLHITSDFQEELSRMMDHSGIGNYYFSIGPGFGGIIGIWDNDMHERFTALIIRSYFLSKGIPLSVTELEPSKGLSIARIPYL